VLPLFKLRLFQQPSGLDLAQLAGPETAASTAAASAQSSALATP
jgi:hypothetical protein